MSRSRAPRPRSSTLSPRELGSRVFVLPCDLRDRAAVVKLGEEAEKTLGQVDILVNNAGITHDNLFMRMKDEEWDDVIAVNLTSVFVLTRGILREHDAPAFRAHRQYRLDLGRARQSGAGRTMPPRRRDWSA